MQNPWTNMHLSSTRRVDSNNRFNFFWINNERGSFGLHLNVAIPLPDVEFIDKIKGVTIIKRTFENNSGDIYLILNNNSDWEIFLTLCNDLFEFTNGCENENNLIAKFNFRLKRWQKFLSRGNSISMPETRQMGLLTELLFLRDYICPNIDIKQAIVCWVGSDFDKQDFSLSKVLVEVKSFITSKGAVIKISSLQQLVNTNKPLFLVSFGISRNENGLSILDLIDSIKSQIGEKYFESDELFESRLAEYGYIEGITETPFYKFSIDTIRAYSVTADFPKILPQDVQTQIVSVEYSIDLSKCNEFFVEIDSIFN